MKIPSIILDRILDFCWWFWKLWILFWNILYIWRNKLFRIIN